MAPTSTVTVLEHCRVAPPPGASAEMSLPLTFFDVIWLQFPHIQRLLFYEYPHPKTHFTDALIPKLKHSLSLTLQHFLPLAGNLIYPSSSSKPEIRYVDGDSLSLIFVESGSDFNYLTENYARNAGEFHHLVPQLPLVSAHAFDSVVVPVVALQVTVFPNIGICIGITNHHVIGDASSIFRFMKAWALITKLGGGAPWLAGGSPPFYDRTVVKDPDGLEEIYRSQVDTVSQTLLLATNTNKVRATFVIGQTDLQRLKELVCAKRPTLAHVSSFTVTCAYMWICLVKSRATGEEEVDEHGLEQFLFAADARAHLNPPIPATYFGNCLAPCCATAKTGHLMGEQGFVIAAELIGEAIRERLHNEEGVLTAAETWLTTYVIGVNWDRLVSVAGSPKFNYYQMDFGWEKPKKFEFVSIDITGAMSLNGCREPEAGLEVGLSLPKIKMDAFATIFADGLKIL